MEKKWFAVLIAVAAFLLVRFISKSNNNVCKTFNDYYWSNDNPNCYYNSDEHLTVLAIISNRGYSVKAYNVTTEDGYILTVFRISNGQKISNEKIRPPVFIQHGLGINSAVFVNTGNKSLAFILADAGYDVWLGNFRGTMYARNHKIFNDTTEEFWNFTFDNLGQFDASAQLDLVYNETKQKIIYIGFSMGSTAGYVFGATFPQRANRMIKAFVSLSPAVIFGRWKSATKYFFWSWKYIKPISQYLTNGEIYLRGNMNSQLRRTICLPYPFQMYFCSLIDMIAWGFNFDQMDPETLPITIMQNADATSANIISQLIQYVYRKKFEKFDYGVEKNLRIYGSTEPPLYKFTGLKVPCYLFVAKNDLLITLEDVEELNAMIAKEGDSSTIHVVKNNYFNHGDFVSGKDVVPLVYQPLLQYIKRLK